jgi:hypothetical protein
MLLKELSAFPITPSDAEGRVDIAALRMLVGRLRAASVGSIGLLGSTGTYAYLSRSERRRAVDGRLKKPAGPRLWSGSAPCAPMKRYDWSRRPKATPRKHDG